MNNNIETYANITGFSNYQVSNYGNVKIVKTGKILKPGSSRGYLYVILTDNVWGVYKDYTPQRSTTTTQGVVVSRYPTDDSTVRLIT